MPVFIEDQQILMVMSPGITRVYQRGLEVRVNACGQAIIQQQSRHGSGAAVLAMLLKDQRQMPPDLRDLKVCGLSTQQTLLETLERKGLNRREISQSTLGYDHAKKLGRLDVLIKKHGSAICQVRTRSVGEHYILVDSVNEQATIRDPYHGWQIRVSRGYLAAMLAQDVLQIRAKSLI